MLKGTKEETAIEIMDYLRNDYKLKPYCSLMDNLELYPLLRDNKG
jgi:hypothetical protein